MKEPLKEIKINEVENFGGWIWLSFGWLLNGIEYLSLGERLMIIGYAFGYVSRAFGSSAKNFCDFLCILREGICEGQIVKYHAEQWKILNFLTFKWRRNIKRTNFKVSSNPYSFWFSFKPLRIESKEFHRFGVESLLLKDFYLSTLKKLNCWGAEPFITNILYFKLWVS